MVKYGSLGLVMKELVDGKMKWVVLHEPGNGWV
jgi:hypothetical protein